MPKYAFFPFIEPTHAGQIVFPDFDTMCTESPVKESEPESPVKERKINIDDLGIDFRKLEISGGRSGKLSNTYKHGELKTFCDILKRRGVTFDGCSKKELVDTILRLE